MGFSRYLVPQKWGMTNSGHSSKYSIRAVLQIIDRIIWVYFIFSVILYPIYDNFIQLILRIPFISNGEFPTNYDFQSLHFHWGTDSTKGSEHLFNSKQYYILLLFPSFNALLDQKISNPFKAQQENNNHNFYPGIQLRCIWSIIIKSMGMSLTL